MFTKVTRQVLEGETALKTDHAVLLNGLPEVERPPGSERGNRQALLLTLIGDFTQCCGRSGSVAAPSERDGRPIERIEIAREQGCRVEENKKRQGGQR